MTDVSAFHAQVSIHPSHPYTIDHDENKDYDGNGNSFHHFTIRSGHDVQISIVGLLDDVREFVTLLATIVGGQVGGPVAGLSD